MRLSNDFHHATVSLVEQTMVLEDYYAIIMCV